MKIVSKEQAEIYKPSKNCTSLEYETGEGNINVAYIEIHGRHPETGLAMNKICTEMVYIIDGEGILHINDEDHKLKQGTTILIKPGEKFYFEGSLKLCVPCHPAWYPEQAEYLKD